MSEKQGKKRLLKGWERFFLLLVLIMILYFAMGRMGVKIGKVEEDTQIIDPYQGQ